MSEIDRLATALADAQRNIDAVRAASEAAGPPCRKCRHARGFGDCMHPAVITMFYDPQSGDAVISAGRQWDQRRDGGLCRGAGVLFDRAALLTRIRRSELAKWAMVPIPGLCIMLIFWLAVRAGR